MEQRHRGCAVGVQRLAEMGIADGAQHVCQQGDLERMLRHVLRGGAAHEAPALDILQPVEIGGEMVVQF